MTLFLSTNFFRRTGVDSQRLIEMSQSKSGVGRKKFVCQFEDAPIPGFW
jgi:hypothetical protein